MMTDEKQKEDISYRRRRVQKAVRESGADAVVLTSGVNIHYLTGSVFCGYLYLPTDGEPLFFVKRPDSRSGENVFHIRKPEQIPDIFAEKGRHIPKNIMLETDVMPYGECVRLQKCLNIENTGNASVLMRRVRMKKTDWEIGRLRLSAGRHEATYAGIPPLFREGMTDVDFQIEIERLMRRNGSIGFFNTYGYDMNIFMGSLLAGGNAETPSPYDFALGGGGQTPLCPIGANGTPLKKGMSVMVDMAGNFTEYLTDMTRTYSIGRLTDMAYRAHQTSLEIQSAIEAVAKAGVACADLYDIAYSTVEKAGLTEYFMGTKQQAKFVGHGIGLEINEPPVLTPRSKDVLEANMTFALEPKFVIPQIGAVGIENSFLVTESGVEKLTVFEEGIMDLE